MKLKTKILFSIMSAIMLMLLLALVESGARLTDSFVEMYMDDGGDGQIAELYLASNESVADTYIISGGPGDYSASCGSDQWYAAELSALISEIESDGAAIHFDNVATETGIALTRRVKLSGEVSVASGGITVSSELAVLDNCNITLYSDGIKIRSGVLRMTSGRVSSDSSAFVLDHSSSARLEIYGGEVVSRAKASAVLCKTGYVMISGGEISNPYGFAIEAQSTVELSADALIDGFEHGVKTSKPMLLSGAEGSFSGTVSVLYDAIFEEGCATVVFRGANAEQLERITLFDALGEAAEITFFESNGSLDEHNFAAVYLPYEVKYFSGGELFYTEKILKNEAVSEPPRPTKAGYTFAGWYTDMNAENAYTFGGTECDDLNLYASFNLTVPTFRINSISFTYDGAERALAFDELYHPLMESGDFSFEWYKDSQIIGYSSASVPICSVSDSGVYNCKLTFAYNGDFVTIITPDVSVEVSKVSVKIPTVPPREYSSEVLYPSTEVSTLYRTDAQGATEVGSYPVTFTLTDPENYGWEGSDAESVSVSFCILPCANAFLAEPSVGDCFSGSAPRVDVRVRFGTPAILYSSDGISFTTDVPDVPGEYYLKITVAETSNFYYLESSVIRFSVLAEAPVGIKLDKAPDKTSYLAFETMVLDGAEFSATYNSGRVEKIDISSLSVTYRSGDCFKISDTCAIVHYGGVSVPVTVSVSAARYDLSGIEFDSYTAVYNGKRQTIVASGEAVGRDGIPLIMKVTGGGVDVGSYTVTLSFSTDSLNYETPSPIEKTLTVLPLVVSVSFGQTSFIYDGTQKVPSASAVGAGGMPLTLSVTGGAINAGSYTAVAVLDDPNYTLSGNETAFEIGRADIDLSGIVWSADEFVYNGYAQSVTVSGLPDSLVLAGYTDSSFTDAGVYTATASVVYDARNYNAPSAIVHEWRILPAEYDFSSCKFLDSDFIYDGNAHYPELFGTIPTGADGSSPSYAFSCGVTNVSEGMVAVAVSFSTDSKNYTVPDSVTVFVKILPRPIFIEWGELEFVYDGTEHLPVASTDVCELVISGSAADAGNYTATALSADPNYTVSNSEAAFVITRAQNCWISAPVVGVQFEGRAPAPYAKAQSGTVFYSYYSDAEMKSPISPPTSIGTYYMVAYVPESRNYQYLSHEPIKVEIVAVEPISLEVSFKDGSLTAMRKLGADDVLAYLLNNDGSITELSFADLTVEYENGAQLLAKDERITLSFGAFSISIGIEVERARYDMSGAYWNVTEAQYTGEAIYSYLKGLPDGVGVVGYVSNFATVAGSYELRAALSYDSENFYEPEAPVGTLVIRRAEIPLPDIKGSFYDGNLKNISVPDNAEYTVSLEGAVSAGIYEAHVIPKDPANFAVAGGGILIYEIYRAPITLKVKEGGGDYSVVRGKIFDGDVLSEEYYTEDGLVYIRISNPNYELTVIPAEAVGTRLAVTIFLIILALLLIILAAFIVYSRRERILAVFSGTAGNTKEARPAEIAPAAANTAHEQDLGLELLFAVDESHANSLISDSLAKSLVTDSEITVETEGRRKCIVNVDTVSDKFSAGDRVDINAMKKCGIIPRDAGHVKVLARGVIDKPITVVADSFSLAAVKMIALTGGHAVRVRCGRKNR